jgi:hypothetical protein
LIFCQIENENLRGEKSDILNEKDLAVKENEARTVQLERDCSEAQKGLKLVGEELKQVKQKSEGKAIVTPV